MNGWMLTAILLAIIFWCIVRIGPRRAERTLRLLARHSGGRFLPGGVLTRNTALIPRGGHEIGVSLRCLSWFGTRYAAEFRAPWGRGRPTVGWSTPTQFHHASGSEQFRAVARQLQGDAAIEQDCVWLEATPATFFSRAILNTAEIAPVTAWFATTARLYELLVAETEAGIEFSPPRSGSGGEEACCQVCGVPPAADETVYCERCGAPHHADCWNYNRGCAIYGCKSQPAASARQ